MDDWTAGDVGGVFAGAVTLLASAGGGIAWLLNWHGARDDNRAERLRTWEKSLAERERAYRLEIEGRLDETEEQLAQVKMELESQRLTASLAVEAVVELAAEIHANTPHSASLARLKLLLDHIRPESAPQLAALAHRLGMIIGEKP